MLKAGLSIATNLWKSGGSKVVSQYWDDALRFLQKNVSMGTLNTLETIGTVSTVGTLVTGAAGGQAKGGFGDYFTGFADLSQEQFHADGGDQSGTTNGHVGKILQNVALAAVSFIPSGKVVGKLGINGAKALYKGIAGWQLASVASDWIWDDHGGVVEDTTDTVMGVASAARFAKLLAVL